jgi:hypothetical protein
LKGVELLELGKGEEDGEVGSRCRKAKVEGERGKRSLDAWADLNLYKLHEKGAVRSHLPS